MIKILSTLDWPNLIVGAILGTAAAFISWLTKEIYEHYILAKNLPYPIWGNWYSAEYDPKGEVSLDQRNTFMRVKISRKLHRQVVMKTIKPLKESEHKIPTGWKVVGTVRNGDTLIGEWKSTLENTKRYGTVVLKFIDYGRAVGYWAGPVGRDYPLYGYVIMSKNETDLKHLANLVSSHNKFELHDVVSFVMNLDPKI